MDGAQESCWAAVRAGEAKGFRWQDVGVRERLLACGEGDGSAAAAVGKPLERVRLQRNRRKQWEMKVEMTKRVW